MAHTEERTAAGDRRAAADEPRSATSVLGDLVHHLTELIRKEIQLLRAEVGEKAGKAAAAVGMIAAAGIISLVALNVLAAALIAAIEELGLEAGWAALIVGGVFALIALGLIMKGVSDLKASSLAPDKTASAVSKDARLAREKAR